MEESNPPVPTPVPTNEWYKATVIRRFFASLVDGFIVIFIAAFLAVFSQALKNNILNLFVSLLYWLYGVFFIWKFGATPGKILLKIKVVKTDYQPVSLIGAVLRETIGKLISSLIFSLGYLWAIWDKDRQTWHDKIAGTYVVTKIPNDGKNSPLLYVFLAIFILIPVVGILATIVLIAINPLDQMKAARDAVRLNELTNLPVNIINASAKNPNLPLCSNLPTPCEGRSNAADPSVKNINGTGWIKVDLTNSTPALSVLPVDPTNSAIYYYQYCSDEINWEISAKFESKKFTSQTANDGGDDPQAFEVGSNQTLCK